MLTQPVPQAGLNTPPPGVYSNQEYLKYFGFELSPAGGKQTKQVFVPYWGVFKPGIFQIFLVYLYTRRGGIQTRFRDRLRTQNNNDLLSDTNVKVCDAKFCSRTIGKNAFSQALSLNVRDPSRGHLLGYFEAILLLRTLR